MSNGSPDGFTFNDSLGFLQTIQEVNRVIIRSMADDVYDDTVIALENYYSLIFPFLQGSMYVSKKDCFDNTGEFKDFIDVMKDDDERLGVEILRWKARNEPDRDNCIEFHKWLNHLANRHGLFLIQKESEDILD